MTTIIMILIALHALSGVFWVGSTFTLARQGGAGSEALFRPQMGAAVVAVLTGAGLWHLLHEAGFGSTEKVLMLGALAAIAAAGVQGALKKKPAVAHRIAAVLLAVTVICMVVSRHV
ncbi:hypothetical protein [Bradyrhizobium sp. 2TAF24]|uniref:hypothetical protein n=1 Tax=Bradyrhizobium sp. 2TAF24 TaxID=3233011 RepID=UPI003F92AAE7